MKNKILLFFVIFFVGCANPLSSWFKAEKKVNKTEEKIQKNEDSSITAAKSYSYGVKIALDLNPDKTNKYTQVAYNLNERTVNILGIPDLNEVLALKIMITNLVSENQKNIIKGEQELAEMDSRVIELQAEKKNLESKLDVAQKRLEEVGLQNSKLANTWAKIKSYFYWGIGIFIFLFLGNTICHALPFPYNSLGYIFGIPFGIVIKLIKGLVPSATKFGGIVAEKIHIETDDAFKQIIGAIQEIKTKIPEVFAQIEPILKDKTSQEARIVINRKKEALGHV